MKLEKFITIILLIPILIFTLIIFQECIDLSRSNYNLYESMNEIKSILRRREEG